MSTATFRVTEVGTSRVLFVTVAFEDTSHGMLEARLTAFHMATAMKVEADYVTLVEVSL
jgi:hypothetical protein